MRRTIVFVTGTLITGVLMIIASVAAPFYLDPTAQGLSNLADVLIVVVLLAGVTTEQMLSTRMRERIHSTHDDDTLIRIANSNVRRESFRLVELGAFFALCLTILAGISSPLSGRLLILIVLLFLLANSFLDRYEYQSTDRVIKDAIVRSRSSSGPSEHE